MIENEYACDFYKAEDSKYYQIKIKTLDNKLILTIKGNSDLNELYSSNYELDNLNKKFGKITNYKSIADFKECLIGNIDEKVLFLKAPYKNVVDSVWKIFPYDKTKKESFTLISQKAFNKNISLLFYDNISKSEDFVKEVENQLKISKDKKYILPKYLKINYKENLFINDMYFLLGKYDNEERKIKEFIDIIKEKENEYGNGLLLIFFDEKENGDDLILSLMQIINKCFRNQIFVLILTKNNVNNLTNEIKLKINKLIDLKLSYFDMDNIFIYDISSLSFSVISIIKVYTYFNQLGDGFYQKLSEFELPIVGLDKLTKNLFLNHYFNIFLCGATGTGKSTFINKIMGAKKAFTLQSKSEGTYRNNFYIHNKYPIKIIDVCGFAEGRETKENMEKLNSIYKSDSKNIIIDEAINDIFTFSGDRRNNIHLLLYFNIYGHKLDILPGELPIMKEALKLNIPIIFVVNKCDPEIFSYSEEEMEDIIEETRISHKGTEFEKFKIYFINCLKSKGFDKLLDGIYEQYKSHLIGDEILIKLKENSFKEEDFNNLFKNSLFFGNIELKNLFLNESLTTSCLDIKNLIVKLGGYYSGELEFFKSIDYFINYKIYNLIWRNKQKNFFPLLTDLVKKIYLNFGKEVSYDQCNKFIKNSISEYFSIYPKIMVGGGGDDCPSTAPAPHYFSIERFSKDYKNLLKLYWYSKDSFNLEENIAEINLKNSKSNIDEIMTIDKQTDSMAKRIMNLVKSDFGLEDLETRKTSQEIIIQYLFYISYVCNELIANLSGDINKKDFKYTSMYNFFYIVSSSYNKAIRGFLDIKNEMAKIEKDLKDYVKNKKINSDAPPVVKDGE